MHYSDIHVHIVAFNIFFFTIITSSYLLVQQTD